MTLLEKESIFPPDDTHISIYTTPDSTDPITIPWTNNNGTPPKNNEGNRATTAILSQMQPGDFLTTNALCQDPCPLPPV